jgi:hypothetical protein
VPLQFKLSHGWNLSNASYTVPPPPPRPKTCALIAERRAHMSPANRSQPVNAQNNPAWPRRFQDERDIELARSAGRFNRIGRHAWWKGRDDDVTLAEYGLRPRIHGVERPKITESIYPKNYSESKYIISLRGKVIVILVIFKIQMNIFL